MAALGTLRRGATMTGIDAVIDRYFAIWNETDPDRRRQLIAETWTEDASYLDPLLRGNGRGGIEAMTAGFHAQFPGARVARTSAIDAHHDRVRFGFAIGPEGGPPLAGGVDVGVVAGDRLRAITGFLDFAPSPAAD